MENFSFKNLSSLSVLPYLVELERFSGFQGEITFSFPAECTYDPFGMLMVGAAIRQFKCRNPDAKRYCHIEGVGSSYKYAGHMGFFKSVSKSIPLGKASGEASGSEKYVPITSIDLSVIRRRALRDKIPVQQQIQTTAQNLSNVLAQGNESLRQTLTYVLREIIRNSEEHSTADVVWVCAQYWPMYQLVEIAILDEGIGIKRSLKSNRYFSRAVQNDHDALKLSLIPGVTEAYKRRDVEDGDWANSGYGLYIAKEICARLGGVFLITSGTSCIGLHTRNFEALPVEEQASLQGTAICMRFRTEDVGDFATIRKAIIEEGQDQARQVKNSIKKASFSSGGLIELLK